METNLYAKYCLRVYEMPKLYYFSEIYLEIDVSMILLSPVLTSHSLHCLLMSRMECEITVIFCYTFFLQLNTSSFALIESMVA